MVQGVILLEVNLHGLLNQSGHVLSPSGPWGYFPVGKFNAISNKHPIAILQHTSDSYVMLVIAVTKYKLLYGSFILVPRHAN